MHCFWLVFPWMVALVFGNSELEVRFETVEGIEGEVETLFEFNIKAVGRERCLNGTIKIIDTFDDSIRVVGSLSFYKYGDWIKSNIRPDLKGCDFMNIFSTRFYKSALKSINFPDPICPLPPGEYIINNAEVTAESWPFYLGVGLAKAEFTFEKNGKVVGGLRLIMNLSEKNM